MIDYTYTIASVDAAARCMEVVYESEGRPTVRMGTRIPYVGESLADVIAAYAPVRYWEELELEQAVPDIGQTGSSGRPELDMSLPAVARRKIEELASKRFTVETSGVWVGGVEVKTDRESQATLASALLAMRSGMLNVIDWKTGDGSWVQLDLAQIEAVAGAVAQHVQAAFSTERALSQAVLQATTVQEVEAIVWPTA